MKLESHRIYRDFKVTVNEVATFDTDDEFVVNVHIATKVRPKTGGKMLLFAMSYDNTSIEEALVRFMYHLVARGYALCSEGDN